MMPLPATPSQAMVAEAMENLSQLSKDDLDHLDRAFTGLRAQMPIQDVMTTMQQEAVNAGNTPAVETIYQYCLVKHYQE